MKITKGKILNTIVLFMSICIMSGCTTEKETVSVLETNDEPIVLQYMGWGADSEKAATEKVIERFEAEHPEIKVEYIHVPMDYNTKISMMLAEGNEPDIAMLEGYVALEWAKEGKLKNIFDLAKQDADFSLEGILPQTIYWWDEGKACGVNSALETYTIFYNKKLTKEAGVEVPVKVEDAWTWEEFVEAAQLLTLDINGRNALDPAFDEEHIKQYGIQISLHSSANMLSLITAYSGEDFLKEAGTKVNLQGTKIEEGLQKIADLIHVYHVAPSPMKMESLPQGATALASGTTAMIWDGQWSLMEIASSEVEFGIGMVPKMYDKPMTFSLGEPIVVFASTKYPKEAWELQKAFMEPSNIIELIEGGLWMPIFTEWYKEEEMLKKWAANNPAHPDEYIDAVVGMVSDNCMPSLNYSIKNFSEISSILYNPLLDVWNGESTVQKVLEENEDKINKVVEGKY